MDFQQLFATQRKFDKHFSEYDPTEKMTKKFFALIVELGEVANESPHTFKFWSTNAKGTTRKQIEYFAKQYKLPPIEINDDPLLEELVDMLHFILSLGNDLEVSQNIIEMPKGHLTNDITELQMRIVQCISKLHVTSKYSNKEHIYQIYISLLSLFLYMCKLLGYNEHSIEDAYYKKNKINFERQKDGY